MEHGIVAIIVIFAILALALLFLMTPRSPDKVRARLRRKSARRTHRSHTHRHSG